MDMVTVPKRAVDLLALIRKDGVIQRASELQEVYRLLAAHSAGAQEPLAWLTPGNDLYLENPGYDDWTPLYTNPQQMTDVARDVTNAELANVASAKCFCRTDAGGWIFDHADQLRAFLAEIERIERCAGGKS